MNPRLKKLRGLFRKKEIHAFLVTKDADITYLTGFPSRESWLLIVPNRVYYITDFRYVEEAKKYFKGVTVRRYTRSIFDTTIEIAMSNKVKRIGFNDRYISVNSLKQLRKSSKKKIKWIPLKHFVESLREIKTGQEIIRIKKAIKLNLEAFNHVKKYLKPGVTERDVLGSLERFVKSKNVDFSFDPIVASGPHSCFPHAKITNRKIRNQEHVLIDLGIDIGGYKSDLTRMFFLGKIPNLIRETYDFVRIAQQKAIGKIRPGIRASEIDKAARKYLKKKRLAKFFGHSLGHGVGLEIHESPTISSNSKSILRKGMIFTVEPAVYIPNKFGVRVEDVVLVTEEGCEVLSDNFD